MTVQEFKEALRIQFGKSVPIEQVMTAFHKFDKSKDGYLDMQEYMLAVVCVEEISKGRLYASFD